MLQLVLSSDVQTLRAMNITASPSSKAQSSQQNLTKKILDEPIDGFKQILTGYITVYCYIV